MNAEEKLLSSSAEPIWSPASAAIFYGCVSVLIMFVNKAVLTTFQFPSFIFLAVTQGLSTIILMHLFRAAGLISFPTPSIAMFRAAQPVPVVWTLNTLTGLGGTQQLSLPMFVALRRFSILMTMVGEWYLLGKSPSNPVIVSVALMIGGAIIAALSDFSFDAYGYFYVLLNDVFTAASGISAADKLLRKHVGTFGLLYLNSAFSVAALSLYLIIFHPDDIQALREYKQWASLSFQVAFLGSCALGFMINYGVLICTKTNSPLTTTVIGCLKNVVTTYVGMFVGGAYIMSSWNFAGLTISMIGSLYYSFVTFFAPPSPPPPTLCAKANVLLPLDEPSPPQGAAVVVVPDVAAAWILTPTGPLEPDEFGTATAAAVGDDHRLVWGERATVSV